MAFMPSFWTTTLLVLAFFFAYCAKPDGQRVFESVRAYVAAVGAGALGDRLGLARVIFLASWLYGGGLLLGS